jgi:hypothetical protein
MDPTPDPYWSRVYPSSFWQRDPTCFLPPYPGWRAYHLLTPTTYAFLLRNYAQRQALLQNLFLEADQLDHLYLEALPDERALLADQIRQTAHNLDETRTLLAGNAHTLAFLEPLTRHFHPLPTSLPSALAPPPPLLLNANQTVDLPLFPEPSWDQPEYLPPVLAPLPTPLSHPLLPWFLSLTSLPLPITILHSKPPAHSPQAPQYPCLTITSPSWLPFHQQLARTAPAAALFDKIQLLHTALASTPPS